MWKFEIELWFINSYISRNCTVLRTAKLSNNTADRMEYIEIKQKKINFLNILI